MLQDRAFLLDQVSTTDMLLLKISPAQLVSVIASQLSSTHWLRIFQSMDV